MSDLAAFASVPATAQVQIATANTARDGTGTIGTLITAPAAGTRVDTIEICAAGATTLGMIRMFIHDGTSYLERYLGNLQCHIHCRAHYRTQTSIQ